MISLLLALTDRNIGFGVLWCSLDGNGGGDDGGGGGGDCGGGGGKNVEFDDTFLLLNFTFCLGVGGGGVCSGGGVCGNGSDCGDGGKNVEFNDKFLLLDCTFCIVDFACLDFGVTDDEKKLKLSGLDGDSADKLINFDSGLLNCVEADVCACLFHNFNSSKNFGVTAGGVKLVPS